MQKYIVSLLQKTSNDSFMNDKKPELSAAMKKKLQGKKFIKNPNGEDRKNKKKCKSNGW